MSKSYEYSSSKAIATSRSTHTFLLSKQTRPCETNLFDHSKYRPQPSDSYLALQRHDVDCPGAPLRFNGLELDRLVIKQSFVTLCLYVVPENEDVFTVLGSDEAVASHIVEPLYFALRHSLCLSVLSADAQTSNSLATAVTERASLDSATKLCGVIH